MPLLIYHNLGLGELAHTKLTVELADRTVKYPNGIAENVLVGIGKFVFPIDFIVLDMPEDVKVPLILERPFLSTAHAKIDVFKRKITLRVGEEKIISKSVKPAIVEDMDPYLDKGMGDVIVGEPFCKASCVEARRFDGIITIRDGDDSVTYQMVRENSRFKHLTNEKCNKIPQLLKMRRSKNGSHAGTLACIRRDEGRAKEKSNLKTWLERKVLPGRQPELFLIYLIVTSLEKEIDNVGGVSIIWNPMCVVVMLEFRRIYNTYYCSYTQLGESYRANIKGFSRSNSFISQF
ncbi:hypothetical protein Tco_0994855 [Tanacetum coccineum]